MSSYVLDRDLMLSACLSGRKVEQQTTTTSTNNNWIDAHSNSNLLSSGVYHRQTNGDTEIKKQMMDLHDQLKMLKFDNDKKDKLICDLSSMKEVERIRCVESSKCETISHNDRQVHDLARRDILSLQSKHEEVCLKLSEAKVKVQAREDRIDEMKLEMETLKCENCSMNSMIVALKNKIKEVEYDIGGFESVSNKSEVTISALQRDNKDLQQNVLELESRIRTHIMEREDAERRTDLMNNKLNELATLVTTVTGQEIRGSCDGIASLITHITKITEESTMIKGRLMVSAESCATNESENKANRETIQRLVNEINKFEKSASDTMTMVDSLKAERDCALNTKTICETEIGTLKERINNIQTAWQSTKTELETKEANFSCHVSNIQQLEHDRLYHQNCLESFREQVASLLSDGFVKVDAKEDQIKEKITLLMTSSKDRGLMIANMEEKIKQLANQLSEQVKLYKEMEGKYSHNEHHVIDLENRFKSLDSEFCANEVMRDNLKSDRVKYLSFLERLGKVLKVSEISADIGLDMNVDLILARGEQLVKLESDNIADKQTNIYNLQRKIKQFKEQLDNKDLHLDLLRKKLSTMEEEKQGKCALEREVDDHVMMSKKFKVKVEKLTEQLSHLKAENINLKAELLDMNGLKLRTCDQDQEVTRLTHKINELESVKDKMSSRLAKWRESHETVTHEVSKTRSAADCTVNAISQELRVLKIDLEKTSNREKSLLDFRNVVARMLGLDANTLSVADYEIIARIERLVSTFNASGVLPVNVQRIQTPSAPQTPTANYDFIAAQYDSNMEPCNPHRHSVSPRHVVHTSIRERSASPHHHRFQHVSNSSSNHHHHVSHNCENKSSGRHRSKSPRKAVTIIDPNSY